MSEPKGDKQVGGMLSQELLKDVAKGGAPAVALLFMGYMLSQQLAAVDQALHTLQDQVVEIQVAAATDRWTAQDHRDYAAGIEERLRELERRVTKLESGQGARSQRSE